MDVAKEEWRRAAWLAIRLPAKPLQHISVAKACGHQAAMDIASNLLAELPTPISGKP